MARSDACGRPRKNPPARNSGTASGSGPMPNAGTRQALTAMWDHAAIVTVDRSRLGPARPVELLGQSVDGVGQAPRRLGQRLEDDDGHDRTHGAPDEEARPPAEERTQDAGHGEAQQAAHQLTDAEYAEHPA